jgi:uncharacterized membrane protein
MIQFLEITKKYGVTGVLAIWLWHTDQRLCKVEEELYDCYKARTEVSQFYNPQLPIGDAILTDKLRIKKSIKQA